MTIYFCGSIAGGRKYLDTYTKIVRYLQDNGHTVPTEHIIATDVLDTEKELTAAQIYKRDVIWLSDSDAAIAEISNPSLGVGYEIGYALDHGKPLLALYEKDLFVSRMITGNEHPMLTIVEYGEDDDWRAAIDNFLAGVAA
jgi:2'-deoxynucleoside 5'-phosphate N-hydrolase